MYLDKLPTRTSMSAFMLLLGGALAASPGCALPESEEVLTLAEESAALVASPKWMTVGPLASARYAHTATLLDNGKVLVIGGYDGASYVTATEIHDPGTTTFTSAAPLSVGHANHTATLLNDGTVLVVGGTSTSAALYDPATDVWTNGGAANTTRAFHTATLLADGRVLVAGGWGAQAMWRVRRSSIQSPKRLLRRPRR